MPLLTPHNQETVRSFVSALIAYMGTPEGRRLFEERGGRSQTYQEALSEEHIATLSEAQMMELIANLWANEGQHSPIHLFNRILSHHRDLDHLKARLGALLWGAGTIPERYDEFNEEVSGIGPAMATEMLTLVHPHDCGIWNGKTRQALKILGLSNVLPVDVYQIDGSQYAEIIEAYKEIQTILGERPPPMAVDDLLGVDCFLYLVSEGELGQPLGAPSQTSPLDTVSPPAETGIEAPSEDVREHTQVQGMLLKIGVKREHSVCVASNDRGREYEGQTLGDLSEDQLPLAGFPDANKRSIELIDVVWFKGNRITHLFEVTTSPGTIPTALLRMADLILLQPSLRPRAIVVAPERVRRKAEAEMARETFKHVTDASPGARFEFMSIDEVRLHYDHYTSFTPTL